MLVAYGAGYIPWFANLDRQMYFFYSTTLAPFLVIGICLVLGDILGRARAGVERRYLSIGIVAHLCRPGRGQLHLAAPDADRRPDDN